MKLMDLLQAMFESADVGLAVLDSDARIVQVNRAFAEFSGVGREAHAGKALEEVIPTLASIVRPLARSVLDTGKSRDRVEIIGEAPHLPGQRGRWFASSWALRDGERVVGVGMTVDRASPEGVEDALRRSEAQFRAICDACPIGIFLTDDKGSSLYSNPANLRQLGISVEETLGDGWQRAIHPDDRAKVFEQYAAAIQGGTAYQGVNRYLHPDGRIVLVRVTATAIYNDKRLIGYVGMGEDITERARADVALRDSELRFRQLAENIRSVFWLRAADRSTLYYLSPAFSQIWGRPVEEAMNDPDSFAESIHPDDHERVLAHMRKPVDAPDEYEYRIVRPDGSIAWIVDRRFPVHDEAGVVVRVAGIATDVTMQKRIEAQLLQSNKLDSIGRLAGGIAHDINNVLTVILNQGIMARRACDAGRGPHEELALIHDAATQAAEVVRRLLTFARRQPFDPALLDLNELIDGVARFLARLVGEGVDLVLSLQPDLGIVRGDRSQLEQVIVNLALNARDAMPTGGKLSIRTRNAVADAASPQGIPSPNGWVVIVVEDTGHGISDADRERIFEPFFSTKLPSHGTGLGLATCYGTMKQHGGHLVVESAVGRGTTFELFFPRADEEPLHVTAPDQQPPPRGTETILVVENEASVRATTVRTLSEHGFVVLEAIHGVDALRVLESVDCAIDLVLTDVVMPELGGEDLGNVLRERYPALPVLYTSGYPFGSELRRKDGARLPFLAKPYDPETLLRCVRDVLDAHGRAASATGQAS
jgi:PAS domain S-box-containing protein